VGERHTILARVSAALRRQDLTAIAVEFAIVFGGVLLGTQVSNWNDDRKERSEVAALLQRLKPDLQQGIIDGPALAKYYRSRIALGEKAERRMTGSGDNLGLVTSARLTGSYAWVVDFDRDTYAMKIGADTVPHIPNEKLRAALAKLIAAQNDPYVRYQYVDSDFRRWVLRIYPSDIANKIGVVCNLTGRKNLVAADLIRYSTTDCAIDLPPKEVDYLAGELRSDPQALGLLREHINRLRVLSSRVDLFQQANRDVLVAMGELPATPAQR